jgi:transcriptional regulator with XRE-family HTH domain
MRVNAGQHIGLSRPRKAGRLSRAQSTLASETPDGAASPDNLGAQARGSEEGPSEVASVGRRVGQSLRRLRKERSLSLDQLAGLSGVSRAALSHIEGTHANPTLSLLWKVAVGLGVPFHSLLGGGKSGKSQVLREGDAPPLRSADGRMESRLLSPAGAIQGHDVYQLRFLPKALHRSEPHGQGTTEVLVVLTGAMRVTVAGDAHELAAGDSIFFHADVPHSYESRSSQEARCVDIISYGRGY